MIEVLARIRKGALVFASGTMLSRISGFGRDVCTAALLGATKELALFFIAFRLSNVFRRLLAETPLSSSVLPAAEKHRDRQKLFFQLTGSGLLITALLLGVSVLFCAAIHPLLAPDWQHVLRHVAIMLPSLLFLVGTGINNIFLQVSRSLFPMSMSSTLCNLVWIGAVPLAAMSKTPGEVLSWSVLVGSIVQYFFTLFWVFKRCGFERRSTGYGFVSELNSLWKPFLLSLLGIAATQLNNGLDPFFAKIALPEAPAYLWYAVRLYLLPLSLIGIAFFSSSFPELAALFNGGKYTDFCAVVQKGISYLALIFIPLSFLMIVCAEDLCTLIYYRGAFTLHDMKETAQCLGAYTLGLTGSALVLFLSNVYYARGEYRWPALASLMSVIVNISLNTVCIFVFGLGASAVALSTSIASLFNMALLMEWREWKTFFFPLFGSTAALFIVLNVPIPSVPTTLGALIHGASTLCLFSCVYLLLFMGKKKAESRMTRP